ncbi:ABC transporter permease [Actinoplanes bogorensis]|uniref:ABC transporter permease n=1 Tax=Paractinoplanes bogorensis TaxID=1610840 RepID=A0ABS5YZL2_9ACTN|nr:ABC transporter permease [Actinoplanes bogorensis]MBU2668890.1 ABC transporter permease [Actinoplanes bogorensis]
MAQITNVERPEAVAKEATAPSGSQLGHFAGIAIHKYAQVILLVVLVIGFSLATPRFATQQNWTSLLVSQAVVAMMTLAVLFPLIVGEFDLSVGYSLGFSAMLGAYLTGQNWPVPMILLAMLVFGVFIGVVNGVLNVYFKINSFIATLGMGIILSALTLALSNGAILTTVPGVLETLGRGYVGGIAWAVWAVLLIAVVCYYLLQHTPVGARLYAIGGSERVAFLAGVRTSWYKVLAFGLAGAIVAGAAMFQLGQAGSATPSMGPDLLLPAYAAAFLGVTTFRPGFYNVPGVIVAILLLAVGFNGLSLLGVPFWVQPMFNGLALLIAVLFARLASRRLGAAK